MNPYRRRSPLLQRELDELKERVRIDEEMNVQWVARNLLTGAHPPNKHREPFWAAKEWAPVLAEMVGDRRGEWEIANLRTGETMTIDQALALGLPQR